MQDLTGRVALVTGGARGIGAATAKALAAAGAKVVVTDFNDGTATAEAVGGAYIKHDVTVEADWIAAVAFAKATFGGLDILVNNASAISLTGTLETPMKRFDLMWGVNARATFACSQAAIPHLRRAANPHILNLSPPLNLDPKWFARHTAYTISKYGMSLCVLGMAAELRADGIAVNALWPRTVIATAALAMLGGAVPVESCRKPEILADAAHAILTRGSREQTGRFLIDDEVLAEAGIADLERYAVRPGAKLITDLFLEDVEGAWS